MSSISPAFSEQEKGVDKSETKRVYDDDAPVYVGDVGTGESSEKEFVETKELR